MFATPAKTVFLLAIAVLAPCGCSLKVSSQGEDACACLKWKEVYTQKYGGRCGAFGSTGREMAYMSSDPMAAMQVVEENCVKFFQRIDDDFCVNWNFNSGDTPGEQWCYVSAQCNSLGSGKKVNANLAYKTCTPGADQKLSVMSPTALADLAQTQDLDMSHLAKFAYPVAGKEPVMTAAQIQALKKSGITSILASISSDGYSSDTATFNHHAYSIISGPFKYRVDFLPDAGQAYTAGRMAKMHSLTCIEGCSAGEDAVSSQGEDAVSSQGEDACACLKWKEVYTKYGGMCSAFKNTGREMAFLPSNDPMSGTAYVEENCNRFFKRIDDDFCVNWNFHSVKNSGLQWCYVSARCNNLGNGTKANANLAYKTCTPDDKKLSVTSPAALADLAQTDDIDLGHLALWSYPTRLHMSDAGIEKVKNSGVPTILAPARGHSGFTVFSGASKYMIDFLPEPDGYQAYKEGRMGKVNGLSCLEGC